MTVAPGGGRAADVGWEAAGVRPKAQPIPPAPPVGDKGYAVGWLVKHPNYGVGRVVEVSGNGLLRKVKIRFQTAGERSFVADKVQLEVLRKG
jgi:DNA helicase-2/ATP-dependent DNA helicase PcrA